MQSIEIRDAGSGASAKILIDLGFNCYSWRATLEGEVRELLWAEPGFETGEKRPSGSGIPLLFPFPGRIGGGQFTFAERKFLLPREQHQPHALHGFVFNRPWRVVDQTESRVKAEFQASVDDETVLNHWPSDFCIRASYEVRVGELVFEAEWENTGYDTLPWGFGTHAYFRLPLAESSSAADTVITVPADGEWQLSDMLPTGQLLDLPREIQLPTGQRLGDLHFDTPYRVRDTVGAVETHVIDPAQNRRVTQSFERSDFPHVVVYTPGHRAAVCIEPYSCLPDPFTLEASGVDTGLKRLEPGETAGARVVLSATDASC